MIDFNRKRRERNEREMLEEMKREKAKYTLKTYLDSKKKAEISPKYEKELPSISEKIKSEKNGILSINEDDLIILNGSIYIKDRTLSQTGITYYRLPLSIKEVNKDRKRGKGK